MPPSAAVSAARSFPETWHPVAQDTYHLLGATTTGSRVLLSPVVFVLRPHCGALCQVLACWPHESSNCCASAPSWRGPVVIRITGTGSARDVVRCFRRFQHQVQCSCGAAAFHRSIRGAPPDLVFEIVPRSLRHPLQKMRARRSHQKAFQNKVMSRTARVHMPSTNTPTLSLRPDSSFAEQHTSEQHTGHSATLKRNPRDTNNIR